MSRQQLAKGSEHATHLDQAFTLPAEVDDDEIAEHALQAAFVAIDDDHAAAGFPVTGDFGPGEASS